MTQRYYLVEWDDERSSVLRTVERYGKVMLEEKSNRGDWFHWDRSEKDFLENRSKYYVVTPITKEVADIIIAEYHV